LHTNYGLRGDLGQIAADHRYSRGEIKAQAETLNYNLTKMKQKHTGSLVLNPETSKTKAEYFGIPEERLEYHIGRAGTSLTELTWTHPQLPN